ncbi:hypothetical protein BBI01_18355 [Chryseobacterium artocarpi]|uniref:Uncharacterized protein n=1 Tax=Chryseobacterium artocarpi TaxID=1414727 RepID=A0A1B8ZC56_9FLAO|nr:hypothetical protein BBI01_18355 [Chryseobacterium artocarpi]
MIIIFNLTSPEKIDKQLERFLIKRLKVINFPFIVITLLKKPKKVFRQFLEMFILKSNSFF